MLAILHARRTTRQAHDASPQRERYDEELVTWRSAFGEISDLYASDRSRVATLRRSHLVRVLHPSGALPALAARRWFGVPFVVHLGYDPARLCRLRGAMGRARMWDVWLRLLAHEASGLLVSANPQRWARSRARVFYAPNGADPSRFNPGTSATDSYFSAIAPYILYVGRRAREKNLEMLSQVCRLFGDGVLRMVDGERWSTLPDIYRSARAFALPSLYEGSPKVLWEAMACGVPALVTSAIEDRPPADTCVLIDPSDVVTWTEHIKDVLARSVYAAERATRALQWVRRKRDARVLIRREVAFALAVSQGVADPVRWVEHATAESTNTTEEEVRPMDKKMPGKKGNAKVDKGKQQPPWMNKTKK